MLLSQLLGAEQSLNINDLPIKNTIASARSIFDAGLGISSSDLLANEIDTLRPFSDELFNAALSEPMFRKIHDAYLSPYTDQPIVSTKVSAGIIYIVRNPLDVLVSYHYHLNKSIESTLITLNGAGNKEKKARDGIKAQFEQYMGGWSHHVLSWTQQKKIPICVVRYEDLLADPQQHFATALEFAQIKTDTHSLKQAIDNTSFSKLKQQEASSRFAETPRDNDQFFRKGKAGGWRNYLTPCQVEQIIEVHGTVMHSLGYLDKDNKPIF